MDLEVLNEDFENVMDKILDGFEEIVVGELDNMENSRFDIVKYLEMEN